ncbi:unnamed protein product [Lymnaea stagnalis]|uniref:Protein NO VEIN C-terminal domain-containing protein n=1 Tax=Lymnaea stagnalis TaxID=6523 RepID=A0AAV2IB76_LYMST
MNIEANKAALKDIVINFLKTCPENKCKKQTFWNRINVFQKKPFQCQDYGVTKMQAVLKEFEDVIEIDNKYIVLKKVRGKKEVVVTDSDDETDSNNSAQKQSSTQSRSASIPLKSRQNQPGSEMPTRISDESVRDKIISVLEAENGQCGLWKFMDCYRRKYGELCNLEKQIQINSDILIMKQDVVYLLMDSKQSSSYQKGSLTFTSSKVKPPSWGSGLQKGHIIFLDSDEETDSDEASVSSQNSSKPKTSGFIPLSGPPQNQGQLSHQRYGLLSQEQAGQQQYFSSPGMHLLGMPFQATAMPMQAPGMNFKGSGVNMQAPRNQPVSLLGMPTLQNTSQSMAQNFLTNFKPLLPQPPVNNYPSHQLEFSGNGQPANPFLVREQPANPFLVREQPANPFLVHDYKEVIDLTQSEDRISLPEKAPSEWPKPTVKSGPPPGTKITDEVKEIVIRPIPLRRGIRLTTEEVNLKIQEYIDLLSGAMEHVSQERVEAIILQIYQVRNFRDLNLNEKSIGYMPAMKEHSMLLGRVNAYIQAFVWSRSLSTLYELKESCREFHPKRKDFDHLKLGPLQKLPTVYDTFKFPFDEYIPEITSADLMEQLNNFLSSTNTWTKQVSMEDFMKYLMTVYNVSSAYSLGIRLRSLPLAIQMLKKSKRDAANTRRDVIENLKEILQRDLHEAFKKFRASILQTSKDGLELRLHYMNLTPEVALREIFTKFEILGHLFVNSSSPHQRKVEKLMKHFDHFVKSVLDVPIPRMLFHLSVTMSNLEVQQSATEFLEEQTRQQQAQEAASHVQQQQAEKKVPPPKGSLTEKLLLYVNKCLEQGTLKLSHLQRIETKTLEDFGFASFQELGYGTFLDFIHSEGKIKKVLEECGGTMLGSGAGGHEHESMFRPSQMEILEFICQTKSAGITLVPQVENSICEQFHVNDLRHLGHGNITRLCSVAEKPGKHSSKEYHAYFEAALCGKSCPTTRSHGQVGIHGSLTKETAMACLTACPLLEDLAEWSHWSLVFQPQHGRLRDFIEKYGGLKTITLEGGRKTATSDFKALEVEPGKFLKICSSSTNEHFRRALEAGDPSASAGHLVSIIVANKGLESTPLALLSNHVKSKLISLHALSSAHSTPGGPPLVDTLDLAVQFVTDFLLRLPLRICAAIANQVLLEPLSQVVGSAKSKNIIIQACRTPWQQRRLELLGCLLGLTEWTTSLQKRFEFPLHCVVENKPDELLGQPEDTAEDEELEEEESNGEESDSDEIDDILSGDEESPDKAPQVDTGNEADSVECKNKQGLNKDELVDLKESQDCTNILEQDISKHLDDVDKKKEARESEELISNGGLKESEVNKSEQAMELEISAQEDVKNYPEQAERSTDTKDTEHEEVSTEKKDPEQDEVSTDANETEHEEGYKNTDEETTMETVDETECTKELTKEEKCRLIVEDIRREEFGVGIHLDETGRKLMLKQQERQGRSLQRLSKDLYSKETHFVLELIQNADDNSYAEDILPSVKFVIDHTGVTVLNNELGFEEKNIRAICDVGKSTKSKHNYGYIGQKGIGFKSVFRVTGCPEVHSNGFHIYFDVNSGPMGYILPHWSEETEHDDSWQTKIALPWTEDIKQQVQTHAARFNDIQPSLLLFLHRLKEISIDNKVEGAEIFMKRQDFPNGEIQITHSHGTDRWLVLRKILDASNVSLQAKSGVEVESTEIALAFPLKDKMFTIHSQVKPEKLPVFAFLPLRSYGFRFIVQGDFDVPSSREDVDRDSSWNQWLRNEIHVLFIEALEAFKAREDLTPIEALILYLQFIPLEGEVMGFFKPVASHILAQLKAKECIPVLTSDKNSIQWKMPSKTVVTHDSLVLEIVSPELLQRHLDLHYLHPDVAAVLNEPLTQALGIESVTTEHLLHIGRSIGQNWSNDSADHVTQIAKWLACVYRSLDDFQENTHILEALNKMRIIPLSSGNLVSLSDVTVFLLTDGHGKSVAEKQKKQGNMKDPLLELKKDLNLVHSDLTNTSDDEVNSQVIKLLIKMGIKQLTAHDLIHSHIMPVLKSDLWKDKHRNILVSYLVYIKMEMERNSSLVDMAELCSVVRLATNHGIKSPSEEAVHFSTAYGNRIDLNTTFPGMSWTLVDSAYLPIPATQHDVQSWHTFLSSLGVTDFLSVQKVERTFDKSNIHQTPWSAFKEIWPDSPDGYAVTDFQCDEFHKLVTANQKPDGLYQQMVQLFERLAAEWDGFYKRYESTQLKSGSGHVLKDSIQTSFAINLKSLIWVPTYALSVDVFDEGKRVEAQDSHTLQSPAELYVKDDQIKRLLAYTVKYLDVPMVKSSAFVSFLQIKSKVTLEKVKSALISWCERDKDLPDVPKIFCTTSWHVFELYGYLSEELSNKDAQDLFHNHPVIFVPVSDQKSKFAAGKMMKREEVWWSDPTGLFTRYQESLELYKSPLSKFKILQGLYQHLEEMFFRTVRVEHEPNTLQLAELLKHIATVKSLSEDEVLADTLFLFSKIGSDLSMASSKTAEVQTLGAMKAGMYLPKVVELLTKAAVFPTKLDQWVSLTDLPMIADSAELEEMFIKKPGVHFLQLEVKGTGQAWDRNARTSAAKNVVDKGSLEFFLSLFKEIKPLTDCVKLEEITPGFQQCNTGQTYLHNIVGLLQRYLYFTYPDVYRQFKSKKAATLKELIFSQVERLEARYELIDRSDICEIRDEKCIVKGKCFYFHEKYVSSQLEINKEVAKFFSEGNEKCFKELRSFLSQAVPIIDGKSEETIESLLGRQQVLIGTLPPEEEVWEVPLPVIPVIPEPEPEMMVYGQGFARSGQQGEIAASGDTENQGIKSWPPRSGLDREQNNQSMKFKKDMSKAPSGIWPPPQAPGRPNVSKLPSNIKFETLSESQDGSSVDGTGHSVEKGSSSSGGHTREGRPTDGQSFSRQVSADQSTKRPEGQGSRQGDGSTQNLDGAPQKSRQGDGSNRGRQVEGADQRSHQVQGSTDRPTSGDSTQQKGEDSQHKTVADGDNTMTGEKRKRKLTEGSSQDDNMVFKRRNSAEDPNPNLELGVSDTTLVPRAEEQRSVVGWGEPLPKSTSSSREVTPSSSSSNQDIRKVGKNKGMLHFSIPLWNESNEDIVYTELARGDTLTLPPKQLEPEAHDRDIGLWGEMLVLDYLIRQKDTNSNIEAVLWANADGEKGLPFDFEIVYKTDDPEKLHSVFVEVKATLSWDKEVFHVSSKQMEFALMQKEQYEIYRVYGAGNSNPKLVRIENIAERMRVKQIHLFMVI